jgi:hypothetical protein
VTALHASRRYFSRYLGNRVAYDDSSRKVPPLLSASVNLSIFHYKEILTTKGKTWDKYIFFCHLRWCMRVRGMGKNKHNSSEAHWSISSVSQAGKKPGNNNQPSFRRQKKKKVHTFILSESLVLVDYDRVLALGSHCVSVTVKEKVRHRFGLILSQRLKINPKSG